jgi:hypothetical protein
MEEVGEASQAMMQQGSGSERAREELVQVAATAIRLIEEPDPLMLSPVETSVNKFPWKEATNVYNDAGPERAEVFDIEGISFLVVPSDTTGIDSGRTRYKVVCRECDCLLHRATTGPASHVRSHMMEEHGMRGDVEILYA